MATSTTGVAQVYDPVKGTWGNFQPPTPPSTPPPTQGGAQPGADVSKQGQPGYDVFGNKAGGDTQTEKPVGGTDTGGKPLLNDQQDRQALQQTQDEYQLQASQVQNTIINIQNGSTPLNAGEQAQVAGLQQQFNALIEQQKLTNIGAEGTANIRGYQTGAAEYDPTFQVKTIGSIVSAGQAKISDLQVKEASAVAALTQSFKDNNIKGVQDAWSLFKDASKARQDALNKTIEDTQKAIKDAQDAKIAADKVQYDRVTKPVQDIASAAAANGASAAVVAAINGAGNVQEAITAAGNSLQTATGDAGAYLFAKRQIESSGGVAPSYDVWYKAFQQQQLDSEISKVQATEGIKFNYALALEKAKAKLADAPTPNYNGEFAATVKLAAQAGGTNAQRSQIKGDLETFIADGDYKSAYTQILSSASAKLTGTNASNFQQQTQSYEAIKDMKSILKEYKAAGGDTNIFKGGADAIQTKIGVLATDARYAALAVRLNSAFQQYRQNMTGAAFGAKESSEYASVLPSSGNTFELNMAKIEGASSYLNSVIEGTITNTVGKGGIYIKQYAEADSASKQTQQTNQDKMTEFRASDPKNEQMVQEMHQQFPDWTLDQITEALQL